MGERGENKTRANFFLYTVYHDSRNCSRDLILALREKVLQCAKFYLANEISQFVSNEFMDRIIRQEARGPHRSHEKTVQIDKHI